MRAMGKKKTVDGKKEKESGQRIAGSGQAGEHGQDARATGKPSAVVDTRVVYCGDNLEQLRKLPDGCVDLIYIDPPFNSNRNYEVFWGETKEKRAFEDRHAKPEQSAVLENIKSTWTVSCSS